jgi:hypothetical protein
LLFELCVKFPDVKILTTKKKKTLKMNTVKNYIGAWMCLGMGVYDLAYYVT